MKNRSLNFSAVLLTCLLWLPLSQAQEAETQNLDSQIQNLKKEVLKLNRDLFILEEELLFPSSTQVSVFVSMDIGEFFKLDSVQLKINDEVVANYLYTNQETGALKRGGVQRLYNGNLKSGEHEFVALFVGQGPKGRDYKRAAYLTVEKSLSPKFLELKIIDDPKTQQPEFSIAEW